MALSKFLVIPQLVYYSVRAPRDQAKAWDGFWQRVRRTGFEGDVLWDAASPAELKRVEEAALAYLDLFAARGGHRLRERAVVSRPGAALPKVVGLDVSAAAVERARTESAGNANVEFRVLDASARGATASLAQELGGAANVFVRGVLHVLDAEGRQRLVDNVRGLLGGRGTLYLSETSIQGDPLDHLVMQGATATSMPDPLRRCIEAGIRPPAHLARPSSAPTFRPHPGRYSAAAASSWTWFRSPVQARETPSPATSR